MGIETERKFLVRKAAWQQVAKGVGRLMRQGYLTTDPAKTIRVRCDETTGYLTIKGITLGISRKEYEYQIPREEATELLDQFSLFELSKTRYEVSVKGRIWEVDEFHGDNEGLITAETELETAEESVDLPEWIGEEVSEDERYYNSSLAERPFKNG